ncbi:FxSxx-COOH system tetratricopeptide repeat protein [Actinomadura sp. HBU206391]|uniref:FxSxx-COOH system tetratricopeptide repeat protein n=1 Tax=Actinomadura sp. HBU206391 TaxID=2731692 RepID=UPI001650550D|nr:FxSxx-COOH system tetratricopeptide repeat protein [Actinomadura sp. HBU206391]MBC6459874.1 tetratricopeptide repeat protein [Actinomadura sp. HBU206391]
MADALWLAAQQAAMARPVDEDRTPEGERSPGGRPATAAGSSAEPPSTEGSPAAPDPPSATGRSDGPVGTDQAEPLGEGPDGTTPATADDPVWSSLQARPRIWRPPAALIGRLDEDPFAGVPPLLNRRRLAHALRPFKRTTDSRTQTELDDEATAERAAEDGLWLPEQRPVRERWLELDVVVDDSRFATLHRPVADQLIEEIATVGAFRHIRIHLLDTDGTEPASLTLRGTGEAARRLPAASLPGLGRHERRIILVLSDGVGDAWHAGAAQSALGRWARCFPVAVVQMLPPRQWRRTGITALAARLHTSGPALANTRYQVSLSALGTAAFRTAPPGEVCVPVLELGPRQLAGWARFVAGTDLGWHGPVTLCPENPAPWAPDVAGDDSIPPMTVEEEIDLSPAELVRRFRAAVPPTVYELAVHLAAAPLNLPVMRLVQRTMLPGSRPADLTELVGSGLLQRIRPVGGHDAEAVDKVTYDFLPGTRAELLAAGRRSETSRVLMTVAEHLGARVGVLRELRDMVVAPQRAAAPVMTADLVPFAEPMLHAFRALAGPYLRPAQNLDLALQSATLGVDRKGEFSMSNLRSDVSSRPQRRSKTGNNGSMRTIDEQALGDGHRPAKSGSADDRDIDSKTPLGVGVTIRTMPPAAERSPSDPPPIWGNVPPRNRSFTGREALLETLHQRLSHGTTAVLPEALHGMGGVGKSQIAIEYVYRHTRDYDLIWWIPSERPGQIQQSLAELAVQMGLPVSTEVNVAVPAVREALRLGRPYRNWLLVFDNAEQLEEVQDFFPTNGAGKILVTSRNQAWTSVASSLEVDVFARDESIALLRLRGPELDADDANELAHLLGDLPLAIEQAAVWLSETGMPVAEYLHLFREKHDKAAELLHDAAPAAYELPVAAAWNVSLDQLRNTDPGALQLLQICAFFAPEPISRRLLSGTRNVDGPPELMEVLSDPVKLGRAVRAINQYALAKLSHKHNTIMLHRLVQRVLVGQMTPQEAAELRHCGHQLLAQADPNAPELSAHWPHYADLLPHVLHSDIVECDDAWARQLVLNQIQFLYQWGDHQGFLSLAQKAVDTWTERLGADHEQTLTAGLHLGRALRLGGRFREAYEHHVRVRDSLASSQGMEDERTLEAQQFVGGDLRYLGEFAQALELDKQSFDILVRRFGQDDPSTLLQAHLYAIDLRLTGDPERALEHDRDTYQRLVNLFGDNHPRTVGSLASIAVDEMESGRYVEGRDTMRQHIRYLEKIHEPGSAGLAEGLTIMSVMERKAGEHDRALELSEQAMTLLRGRYGQLHPSTVAAAMNHAVNLRQVGDLSDSISLARDTIKQYEAMFGPKHPNTPSAHVNLAVALRLDGQVTEARETDEAALATLTEVLGANHPRSIVCSINLASDLHALGEFEAALRLDLESLERAQRSLGDDHPTTLACALNYALDLRAVGRESDAETRLADAMARLHRRLGDSHPAVISARRGIRADCDIFPIAV